MSDETFLLLLTCSPPLPLPLVSFSNFLLQEFSFSCSDFLGDKGNAAAEASLSPRHKSTSIDLHPPRHDATGGAEMSEAARGRRVLVR